jgi:hypothetical protein
VFCPRLRELRFTGSIIVFLEIGKVFKIVIIAVELAPACVIEGSSPGPDSLYVNLVLRGGIKVGAVRIVILESDSPNISS